MQDLPRMLREMSNHDSARRTVAQVLHQMTTALERTAELLCTHLNTTAFFVSPPGMLYWGGVFQQFLYMLTEICLSRDKELYMCAPNLRVGGKITCVLQRYRRTPT